MIGTKRERKKSKEEYKISDFQKYHHKNVKNAGENQKQKLKMGQKTPGKKFQISDVKSGKGIISKETNENTITTTCQNKTQVITLIRPNIPTNRNRKKIRKKDKQSKLIINEVTKGF